MLVDPGVRQVPRPAPSEVKQPPLTGLRSGKGLSRQQELGWAMQRSDASPSVSAGAARMRLTAIRGGQAYSPCDAADASEERYVPGVPATAWRHVAAAPGIEWRSVPLRARHQCCSLPASHDMVDFGKDCSWDSDASAPANGTASAWRAR